MILLKKLLLQAFLCRTFFGLDCTALSPPNHHHHFDSNQDEASFSHINSQSPYEVGHYYADWKEGQLISQERCPL